MNKDKLNQIQAIASKRGLNPVIGTIYQQQQKWISWYRGNVQDFHYYNVKNVKGQTHEVERKTLNLAKKICEDWSTLLYSENTQLIVNDDDINKEVWNVLENNNFKVTFNDFLEKTFAIGTGLTTEFIYNNEVMIDFIKGDTIIISSFRNLKPNGVISVNEYQQGEEHITHLTYHLIENGLYTIEHEVYVSEENMQLGNRTNIGRVFNGMDGETLIVEYETNTPHFQVWRPNITNNYDLDSPMGMSVFANAIDNLKSADNKYDSFDNEYELARHRMIMDTESVTEQIQEPINGSDGSTVAYRNINVFDTKNRLFLGANLKDSDKKFIIYNADIRATEHIDGINNDVQRAGFSCGMGTDYYAFDARGVYQNEKAIVSENSDLWSSKKKHEKIIVQNLKDMLKSIVFLLRETGVIAGDIDQLEYNVKPDDSIIIDDEALYQKDLELYREGAMPMWKILVKWFGLTEEEAKEQIKEAELENGGLEEEEYDNPMPSPTPNESEEEFIQRFMSDSNMINEFEDEEQRRAIAQEQWNKSGS